MDAKEYFCLCLIMGSRQKGWYQREGPRPFIFWLQSCWKATSDLSSWRPVAWTSTFGKWMENMINNVMMYFVQKNELLALWQSGCRNKRITIDHTVELQAVISSLINSGDLVGVIFGMQKQSVQVFWFKILREEDDLGAIEVYCNSSLRMLTLLMQHFVHLF